MEWVVILQGKEIVLEDLLQVFLVYPLHIIGWYDIELMMALKMIYARDQKGVLIDPSHLIEY